MKKQYLWAKAGVEPSIADLLADPIAQALMKADGIVAADVVSVIRSINVGQDGAGALMSPCAGA